MPSENADIVEEVKALRVTLAALARQLEPFEEWRALCQLDEREKAGCPLESIDGVIVRGKLAKQLAEKSRVWRAYVKIEDALGELRGEDAVDAGVFYRGDAVDLVAPVVADVITSAPESVRVEPAPKPSVVSATTYGVDVSLISVVPTAAVLPLPQAVIPTVSVPVVGVVEAPPTVITDSHQRMRVKVRAASIALPMIVAAASVSREAKKLERDAGMPSSNPVSESEAPADPAAKVNDALPLRDALERIRPMRDIAARTSALDGGGGASVDTAIWGARATDAPEPDVEIITVPLPAAIVKEAAVAERNERADAVLHAEGEVQTTADVSVSAVPGLVPVVSPQPLADSDATPLRVAAIETAIAHLGDSEIVGWTAPLEVIESRAKSTAGDGSFDDGEGELQWVDEAEVEIVTAPVVETTPAARDTGLGKVAAGTGIAKAPKKPDVDDEALEPQGYAAYHLDVEEASVEIVVPRNDRARAPA